MTLEEKKSVIPQTVEELFPLIEQVNRFLFDHAELGNEEFESSRFLAQRMEDLGFQVQLPYAGIETAMRADFRNGEGPTVAFLAEYDALPGYGPNHDQVRHACGHNWIAATCFGAALALLRNPDLFQGTVSVIAAPAEETVGGKIDVLRNHGYDDVDAAMQIHLGNATSDNVHFLAMDSLEFTFHGKAAHASGQPHLGINALDAVMLTFSGINCLRQHITPDARIHGIVTEGGKACNIVPDYGQCRFYIRAAKRSYLNELTEKVINVARGAALMTGAEMEYRYFENPYDDFAANPQLQAALRANMELLGEPIAAVAGTGEGFGSSDVGNVSQHCAAAYLELATGLGPDVSPHMDSFLDGVVGRPAERTLRLGSAAMAMTALDFFEISR